MGLPLRNRHKKKHIIFPQRRDTFCTSVKRCDKLFEGFDFSRGARAVSPMQRDSDTDDFCTNDVEFVVRSKVGRRRACRATEVGRSSFVGQVFFVKFFYRRVICCGILDVNMRKRLLVTATATSSPTTTLG